MRWKKFGCLFGAIAGGLLLLLIIGFVVLLQPGVQTALAKQFAEPQFESFSLKRIAAGFNGLDVDELALETENGVRVELANAQAEVGAMDLLGDGLLQVDTLLVEGLVIDSRAMVSEDKPTEPVEFPTELPEIALPRPLAVDTLKLEGRWLGPGGLEATFDLSGTDIRPGKENTISGDLAYRSPQAEVQTTAVRLTFFQSDTGQLTSLQLTVDARVTSEQFAGAQTVGLRLNAEQDGSERLDAELNVTIGDEERIALLVEYGAPQQRISGSGRISVDAEMLNPILPTALPPFAVDLRAEQLTYLAGEETFATEGLGVEATLPDPGALVPALEGVPALRLETQLSASLDSAAQNLQLQPFALELRPATAVAGAPPFLQVSVARQFSLPLSAGAFSLEDLPAGELGTVRANRFPLTWVAPLIADLDFGPEAELSAALILASTPDGGYEVRPVEGASLLRLRRLALTQGGQQLLRSVDLRGSLRATYGENLAVRDLDIDVADERGNLLSLQGSVEVPDLAQLGTAGARLIPGNGQLRLNANLPQLLNHPIFQDQAVAPRSGTALIELRWRPREAATGVTLTARLSDLVTRDAGKVAEMLELHLDSTLLPDRQQYEAAGTLTFTPDVAANRTNLDLTARADLNAKTFDAALRGNRLDVDALTTVSQALLRDEGGTEEPSDEPAPETEPQDETAPPAWAGWEGQAEITLDDLLQGGRSFRDVKALAVVADDDVTLEDLSLYFEGAPLTANGKLDYEPNADSPYQLTAKTRVERLPIGNLLAPDPGSIARLAGDFSLDGEINATGKTLNDLTENLIERAGLKLSVSGDNGVLRAAAFQSSASDAQGRLLDTALGFAAGSLGESVSTIWNTFRSIEFSELRLAVERERDGNRFVIPELRLVSDSLTLTANGFVPTGNLFNLAETTLQLNTELLARGSLAKAFVDLNLANLQPGETETTVTTFPVTGTISNPNFSALTGLLNNAIQSSLRGQASGQILERLFPGNRNQSPQSPSGTNGSEDSGDADDAEQSPPEDPLQRLQRGILGELLRGAGN